MRHLKVTEFLIKVAGCTSQKDYDAVVVAFIEEHRVLMNQYEDSVRPKAPENDPFPEVSRSVRESATNTLKAKLEAIEREFKTIIEEASGIWRARNDFILRLQKGLGVAIAIDHKSQIHSYQLNELSYQIAVKVPVRDDVEIPE